MIFHWAADKEQAFGPGNSFPALLVADTHGSQPRDAGLDDRCMGIDHRDQGNPASLRVPTHLGRYMRIYTLLGSDKPQDILINNLLEDSLKIRFMFLCPIIASYRLPTLALS